MNHYMEEFNRSTKKEIAQKKKKFDFILCKDNTLSSLKEVEYFLNNFNTVFKSITIYKILKK